MRASHFQGLQKSKNGLHRTVSWLLATVLQVTVEIVSVPKNMVCSGLVSFWNAGCMYETVEINLTKQFYNCTQHSLPLCTYWMQITRDMQRSNVVIFEQRCFRLIKVKTKTNMKPELWFGSLEFQKVWTLSSTPPQSTTEFQHSIFFRKQRYTLMHLWLETNSVKLVKKWVWNHYFRWSRVDFFTPNRLL